METQRSGNTGLGPILIPHSDTTEVPVEIGGGKFQDNQSLYCGEHRCHNERVLLRVCVCVCVWFSSDSLTGAVTVTTPYMPTMFGCENCPMTPASCKNLTPSSSEALCCRVFTATCRGSPSHTHRPLCTVPNCPEPSCSNTLGKYN